MNSIDNISGPACQASFPRYTIHINDHQLSNQSYSDEVCINSVSNDANSILNQENNDICWSTILTDADLELVDPTNYAGQIVHTNVTESASLTCSGNNGVTTHLTAVEPHTLHLVTSSPTHAILDDAELFRNPQHASSSSSHSNSNSSNNNNNNNNNNGQLSILNGSDVISANHNVVTCVNPSNQVTTQATNHWANWSAYGSHSTASTLSDPQACVPSSHDLLHLQQIDKTVNPMSTSSPNLFISVNESTYLNQAENQIMNPANCQLIEAISVEKSASASSSGVCFDSHSQLSSWIESKAALEATAFDLDQFDDLENCADF